MLELFRIHGPLAFVVVALGVAAVAVGGVSIALAKARTGAKVGLAALALVAATGSATVAGVMSHRMRTDRAATQLEEPTKSAYERQGYDQSASLAKVGLFFAAIAFVTAVVGTLKGLGIHRGAKPLTAPESKRPPGSETAPTEENESMLGLGSLVVGSLAMFSIVAMFMPLVMKPKGTDLPADDPALKLREAERLLSEGKFKEGCAALEEGFKRHADPGKAKVRSIEGLVSECFDQKLEAALSAPDAATFDALTAELRETSMPIDDAAKRRLESALEARRAAGP